MDLKQMFGRKIALLLFLTFYMTQVNAVDFCNEVNLYQSNSTLNSIPIVNQAKISSCYAQTAAQMVEYHMRENLDMDDGVRGLYVALNHKIHRKIHWKPNKLGFSLLSWAIKDLKRYGNCSLSNYDVMMKRIKRGNNISDDDMIHFIQSVWKKYHKLRKKRRYRPAALSMAYNQTVHDKYFRNKITKHLYTSLTAMKSYKRKRHLLKYLNKHVFKECSEKQEMKSVIPEVFSTARGLESSEKVQQIMTNVLTSNNPRPIGLGYCSNILKNPPGKFKLMKRPRLGSLLFKIGKCSAHYSAIVGQRPVKNSCQYLIRNSYGTGFWAQGRECFCEFPDGSRGSCSDKDKAANATVLGCWIDGKELADNTFDMSYFIQ